MATDAIIVLEKLHCIREKDGSGHSEPYIWPVLIWIDDDTLDTPALVGVTAPAVGSARVVIQNNMRALQTADIPSSVGTLRVRLDDDQMVRQLILVVAFWENDETPEKAMHAGYVAFSEELGRAVADHLLELRDATTPEALKPIVDEITTRVSGKVKSAIRGALTGSQKVRVKLGTLNLDDLIASGFKSLPEVVNRAFTLSFASPGGARTSNIFTIDARLQAVPVVADPCAAQAAGVRDAQAAVNDIEEEIRRLQKKLRGQGEPGEPSLPKPVIIAEIKRLRQEELPSAEAAIEAARKALAACRGRPSPVVPPPTIGLAPADGG